MWWKDVMRKRGAILVGTFGMAVAGCGAQGGSGGSMPGSMVVGTGSTELLPLSVGLRWTYQVTSANGSVSRHPTTIEAQEQAPTTGQSSFRVRYELPEGTSLRWEQNTGSTVVRYEEDSLGSSGQPKSTKVYMPSEVVLDESPEHLTAGASWTEMYKESKNSKKTLTTTQATVQWTVLAVDEMVTVPAGTVSCLKVQRVVTSSSSPSPEVTWYAAGVGKVKETGAGPSNNDTLELASMP